MSESIPSSTTGFAHRRNRADSITSFTYYDEVEESPEPSTWPDDEAIVDDEGDDEDLDKHTDGTEDSQPPPFKRRQSSGFSRLSVEDPLLHRHDSTKTDIGGYTLGGRTNQKIYIATEDLTVVFAGFKTSPVGFMIYVILCILSFGLGCLVFRWLPRWKVWLVGRTATLKDCSWVVIEVSGSIISRNYANVF
jgi:cation-transporting ATPase 13A3/4/5